MRGIDSAEVGGRAVFLRADLNVPLDGRRITDDGRVRASLPTITKLAGRGARVIVCAHLGRPKGADFSERAAAGPSLEPVAGHLSRLLGQPVGLAADVAGPSAAGVAAALRDGDVAMLENVRFEPAETSRDDQERIALASRLAAVAAAAMGPHGAAGEPLGASGSARAGQAAARPLYVGDGFGAVHRKHASVYDLPRMMPHAAGDLVLAEVEVLRRLTTDPARPYVLVLGGAKPSDKLGVIGNLLGQADRLIIGGGMSYTFLAAQGHEVGNSLLEKTQIPHVSRLLAEASGRGVEIVLPVDVVAATHFAADAGHDVVPADAIPPDREGMDMGPATRALFAEKLADAKTVFWNGPMGVFEFPAFAAGTLAVATAISQVRGLTVVGGGDSAAAVRQLGLREDAFGHISTGGGASLEYLEGTTLPGLTALEDAP